MDAERQENPVSLQVKAGELSSANYWRGCGRCGETLSALCEGLTQIYESSDGAYAIKQCSDRWGGGAGR